MPKGKTSRPMNKAEREIDRVLPLTKPGSARSRAAEAKRKKGAKRDEAKSDSIRHINASLYADTKGRKGNARMFGGTPRRPSKATANPPKGTPVKPSRTRGRK